MVIFDNYFGRKVSRKLRWITQGCERKQPAPWGAGKKQREYAHDCQILGDYFEYSGTDPVLYPPINLRRR